jgi:glycogen(starch) synthase
MTSWVQQMQSLQTSDYRGSQWPGISQEEEEEGYPLYVLSLVLVFVAECLFSPLVMKVRSRAGSVMSGASTPGVGGQSKSLSEGDLQKADEALSNVAGQPNGVNGIAH